MNHLHKLEVFVCLQTLSDLFCLISSGQLYNVALYKPAFQSSVFGGNIPDRGNDGRMNGWISSRNCIHTELDNIGWWMVDLVDSYVIRGIFLTNRYVIKRW